MVYQYVSERGCFMMKYWIELKKDLQDRLKKAVPADLKDYVGLVDAKGYCDLCHQKKVLLYERVTKKSLCIDCRSAAGYEYTAIEFDNMWQLVQDTLFYTDEIIMELMYPNLDFTPITSEKMKQYLLSRGWNKKPFGNNDVWKFTHTMTGEKSVDFVVLVPARTDLIDYKRATEIVIEIISVFEKRSLYEVFLDLSR